MSVTQRAERAAIPRPPVATRGLLGVAAALVALLLAVASRYGYHRDELYFLVASRHLAWGYVDQPPLTPALAGLARLLFGDSLLGLRLLPALAVGALVVVTGLLTRELGGGRAAQLLAAACVAGSGVTLGTGHLHSTTTYDLLAWAVGLWLLVRLLGTGDRRLWLPIGLVAGVGLLNKATMAQLAGAGLVGVLADRDARSLLASRWLLAGAAVAALLWAPYLAWQAGHGWPQLAVFADLRAEDGGLGAGLAFLPLQLLVTNPLLAPVWLLGLVALLRDGWARAWRPLAVAYLVFVAFYMLVGGKPYYAFGFYPVLFAAGAVRLARRRERHGGGGLPLRRLLPAVALAAALPLPLLLPVLPASTLTVVAKANYDAGETFAWPTYVAQVLRVRDGLPPAERAAAIAVTANYGEAGALARYGGTWGRDAVFSGHNSSWWWGPPSGDGRVVIVVGYSQRRAFLQERFRSVTLAARLDNGQGVDNEEQGQPVWVCRDLTGTWASTWLGWRHYSG
ncbi:MAG TPA: glycosyltransferase family 39 protein [Actinomycetes bacterium]|nr:glycosyltransferase family 39 protein [Actinomycetes bacterium]